MEFFKRVVNFCWIEEDIKLILHEKIKLFFIRIYLNIRILDERSSTGKEYGK